MSRLSKVRKLLPGASDEKAYGLCRSISADNCVTHNGTRTNKALVLDGVTGDNMQTEYSTLNVPGSSASTSEPPRVILQRRTVSSSDDKAWSLSELRILHQLQKPILIISYDRLGSSTTLGFCS